MALVSGKYLTEVLPVKVKLREGFVKFGSFSERYGVIRTIYKRTCGSLSQVVQGLLIS